MSRKRKARSSVTAAQKRCPRCGSYPCRCPKPKSLPPEQQTAAIRREKKGRGGKTVIVISDLQLTAEDMKGLAKQLKKAVGAGGSVKNESIEIQGENRDAVAAKLQQLGYKTKFTGG